MRLKNTESGTFWVLDARNDLPPACRARIKTDFEELTAGGIDDLAAALNLPTPDPIRRRWQQGRRCFLLKAEGHIAAYGWVTLGPECVGELEREFNLEGNEAYIWDCGTVPHWRQHGLYSSLLSQIIYQLRDEGVPRIWIGASRQNRPSVRGIENAGFDHVLDLVYYRFYRVIAIRIQRSSEAPPDLVSAAFSIILQDYERRFGDLAVGWYPHNLSSQKRM